MRIGLASAVSPLLGWPAGYSLLRCGVEPGVTVTPCKPREGEKVASRFRVS
jgi:hypothetical protein